MNEERSNSGLDVHEYVKGRRPSQLHEGMTRLVAKRKRQAERAAKENDDLIWRRDCKGAIVQKAHRKYKRRRKLDQAFVQLDCFLMDAKGPEMSFLIIQRVS